jgi:cytidyltransferase-like protein
MKIVIVTGGFDPIHSGHISYLTAAKELGDILVVGVNSDKWLTNKKGKPFMDVEERKTIIANLKMVDKVIEFDDSDGTANQCIAKVRELYPSDDLIFANGGDRTSTNIPEMSFEDVSLTFEFGVGGEDKKNSSSWILSDWKEPKTGRAWGNFRVLYEEDGIKVKELYIEPGRKLSKQRHAKRNEYWMVAEGEITVESAMSSGYSMPSKTLTKFDTFIVPVGEWHRLVNHSDRPCKIVEIQYGEDCDENDIERIEQKTVFVGWDSREPITYDVCEHSIKSKNKKVEVIPLKQQELRNNGIYWRPADKFSTTEFTFSRFLIPYLSNYKGWAIFCDSDFVFIEDIEELFKQADEKYAVMCVHHDYTPEKGLKMDGMKQRPYPRKNWSSLILFNCGHPKNKVLTPELVNTETGLFLHRFSWLDDSDIGSLSHTWNWLVGWYQSPEQGAPRALHYTEGGPWFKNYRTCEYADVWMDAYDELTKTREIKTMDAYIIHLPKIPASLETATNLKAGLESYGIKANLVEGVMGPDAVQQMEATGRKAHPWGIKGPSVPLDPNDQSVLKAMAPGVRGCFMSHYNLWKKCVELDKPIFIFEDDVVLTRGFMPVTWNEVLIVAIGHPTKSAEYWDYLDNAEGRPLAEPWTKSSMPGAMGYAIKPKAAKKLLAEFENTFLPADNAINQHVVEIEITTHLMGRALVDEDGKKSLTRTKFWNDYSNE